jgi:hypothetical protein
MARPLVVARLLTNELLTNLRSMKKKRPRRSKAAPARTFKLAIRLSPEAKRDLEELRVRSLDKHGRKPTPSQVVENLIESALRNETIPYPVP